MSYPSKNVKKFGLVGTSCAGKTTLAYEILAHLKRRGIHADGVLQQDRRFSFERARLEDDPVAQWSFIANQVKAEADMMLRPGTEVLVCDRTPLDFYAYYEWQYGPRRAMFDFVLDWCLETFECIYLLEALPFVDDGARLNEEGRDAADKIVRDVVARAKSRGLKIINVGSYTQHGDLPREGVTNHLMAQIESVLTEEQLGLVPDILGLPEVLIGGSYAFDRAKKWSDLDVYILTEVPMETGHPGLNQYLVRLKDVFGIPVEVRGVVQSVYNHLHYAQGFKRIQGTEAHERS